LVIAVDRVVAYPSGFELALTVRSRERPVHRMVPDAAVDVRAMSGSCRQTRYDQQYWAPPLPRPGPVVDLDGAAIAEAGARAEDLWP
jgi:hypothetical protein